MQWLIFALIYASVGAGAAFLDKVLLNYKLDPTAISSFRLFSNALIALPFMLLVGFQIPNLYSFQLLIFASVIYAIGAITYFIALSKTNVSKIIPYRDSIVTIASFLLAIFLLAEQTNLSRILGVILISVGAYFVLTNGKIVIPKTSSSLVLMAITGIVVAIFGVIVKIIVVNVNPISTVFLNYLSVGLILLLFNTIKNRNSQTVTLKKIFSHRKIFLTLFFASLFAVLAWYSLFTALSIGNASQILPINGVIPLFAAILGTVFLKEKYGIARVLATLLIVFGVYAIYV